MPGYFETMGIPILRGRGIDDIDGPDTRRVIVISEAVADGLFGDRDPIGQLVNLDWHDPYEIVGIVANAKLDGVRAEFPEAVYISSAQFGATYMWLTVRTETDPLLLTNPIREILREMDADVVFSHPRTMTTIVDDDLSGLQIVTTALGLLAGIALLLTTIGLYGVLAYHVNQRIGEFGIRIAIGAPARKLMALVVDRGIRMVCAGLLLGILASLFGTRLVQELLFKTDPLDPLTYLGAVSFLGVISLTACILPAWRAIHVNPVEVLRKE
jgi:putative ABC transport system permease protein